MWDKISGTSTSGFKRVESFSSIGSARSNNDPHELDDVPTGGMINVQGREEEEVYILEGMGYDEDEDDESRNKGHSYTPRRRPENLGRHKDQAIKLTAVVLTVIAIVFIFARAVSSPQKTLKVVPLTPQYDESDKARAEFVQHLRKHLVTVDSSVDQVSFDGPIRVVEHAADDPDGGTRLTPVTLVRRVP